MMQVDATGAKTIPLSYVANNAAEDLTTSDVDRTAEVIVSGEKWNKALGDASSPLCTATSAKYLCDKFLSVMPYPEGRAGKVGTCCFPFLLPVRS